VQNLQNKIKEQDQRIDQLFEANKEFKNSILSLYLELEKRKNDDKVDVPGFYKFFKNAAENYSNGGGQKAMKNLIYMNGNNMNNYKCNSFMPNMDLKNGDNIIYDKGNNFSYLKGNQSTNNTSQYMNCDGYNQNKFMLENGHPSPAGSVRDFAMDDRNQIGTLNYEAQKSFVNSPSPVDNDTWKKMQQVNQRPRSPSVGLNDQRIKAWEKSQHIFSQEHSVISDYDHVHVKQELDKISMASDHSFCNPKMPPIIINPENSAFD